MLDSLSDENADLLRWLSDSSIEQIESGDGYHLESNLGDFARGYLSSEYAAKAENLQMDEAAAFSEANIRKLVRICRDIINTYDAKFRKAAKDAWDLMRSFVHCDDGLNSYVLGKVAYFVGWDGRSAIEFGGSTWSGACVDGWKAIKTKKYFSDEDAAAISERLSALMDLSGREYTLRSTAAILLRQVYVFRVADTLRTEFDALLDEKNVLSLEDTNTILRDIIGGSDAPFIYEKTGTRYNHFLLDEFQDTSNIQWDNFRPLLQNSISEGSYNLIVGDIKQSIYRWRDADWKILGEKVGSELQRTCEQPLDTNWRSALNVIDFNNAFHRSLAEHLGMGEQLYKGVAPQKYAGKSTVPGCIDVTFCKLDLVGGHVVAAVKDAHSRGFKYSDIAVIVRTNAQGGELASRLIAENVPVITNDSLRISNGLSVRQIVSGLFHIDDPEDKINAWFSSEFDYEAVKNSRSLGEMVDALAAQLPPEQVNSDTLYMLAFMDLVRDFVSRNGNSLHAFLQYWKEDGMKKSICSPDGSDAVTVITVHKCKGLSYPYVVLPLPDYHNGGLSKCPDSSWEVPDTLDTPFEECAPALYHVKLGNSCDNTLFAESYHREIELSHVDNANVWYVAMTRAEEQMCIIAPNPSSDIRSVKKGDIWPDGFKNIYDALYLHIVADNPVSDTGVSFEAADPMEPCLTASDIEKAETPAKAGKNGKPKAEIPTSRFIYGELSKKAKPNDEKNKKPKPKPKRNILLSNVPEKTLSPVRGSVRISNDAADFFAGVGETSPRKRGSVLHGILEHVMRPEDLPGAVRDAVSSGLLSEAEALSVLKLLSDAISSAEDRLWFSPDECTILDERDIIVPGSGEQRPDRVVLKPDGVDIIDYKFGVERRRYTGQVSGYMSLYRRMGYSNVRGYLWYVEEGRIEEVFEPDTLF